MCQASTHLTLSQEKIYGSEWKTTLGNFQQNRSEMMKSSIFGQLASCQRKSAVLLGAVRQRIVIA
jgi:hypothetical protein